MHHTSQVSLGAVPYTVMVPHPGASIQHPTAATPPPGANEFHEEEYESVIKSKLGSAVDHPTGDGA